MNEKKPIHKKTWFIIFMCWAFFPVGLYLLWKSEMSKGVKIGVTSFIVLVFVVYFLIPSTHSNDKSDEKEVVVEDTEEKDDTQQDNVEIDEEEEEKATAIIDKPTEDEISNVSREYLHENAGDYEGKWIRTAGSASYVNIEDDGDKRITMVGKSEIRELHFYLMSNEEMPVSEGDYVVVVGKVEGKILGQALIYNCYIESSGDEAKLMDEQLTNEYSSEVSNDSSIFGTSEINRDEAIPLTAYEAYQELQSNQVAAKNNYDGKLIALTGVIEDIGTNVFGQEYVTFETGEMFSLEGVQCFFKDDQMDYVAGLSKGQTITIYGYADIGSMTFKLASCQP